MQGAKRGAPFFVTVVSKELSHTVSLLFATLTRRSISVAFKGLTLQKAEQFRTIFGCGGEMEKAPRDVPER
jgi:hypothetical protein